MACISLPTRFVMKWCPLSERARRYFQKLVHAPHIADAPGGVACQRHRRGRETAADMTLRSWTTLSLARFSIATTARSLMVSEET
jgi:hypothetical protein